MSISEEFKSITGFEIFPRRTNFLSDRIERKDPLFSILSILYFSNRKRFKRLLQKIKAWLRKEESETIFALAGYIYYITEDFDKAKRYFLKALSINPDNLDNWVDLAFTLRHLGEYNISNGMLFNFDYLIYYYKYLKLSGCNYSYIRKLVLEIAERTHDI